MDRVSNSPNVSATLEPEKLSLADRLISINATGSSVDIAALAMDVAGLKGQVAPHDYAGLKQEVESKLSPFDSGHFSQTLANAEPLPDASLGHVSAMYESKGHPGAVSPGKDDPGRISYGTYQIRMDNVSAFLKHEGSQWRAAFAGKQPGTPEFGKAWKDIANRAPDAFQEAQHKYIERSHYTPVVNAARQATNVDISQHSKALQNAVWSTAVQHGPRTQFVTQAIDNVKEQNIQPDDPDFDRSMINAIYDERGRTNAKGQVVHFHSSSPAKQQEQLRRFANERDQSLQELEAERRAASKSAQPEKGP